MYLTNNQNPGRLVNNLYPCSWWWHIRCLPLGIGIWFFRFEFTQWFGISRNRCKLYTLTSEVVAQTCCTRQAILTDTKTWFCWMVGWSLSGSTKQFNSDFRRAAHCQWPMAEHIPYAIKLKEHRIKVYPNLGKKTCSSPRAYEFVELDLNQRNTSQGLMNPGSSKAPGMNAAHLVTGSLILEPCPYTWDTQTKVLVSLSSTLCTLSIRYWLQSIFFPKKISILILLKNQNKYQYKTNAFEASKSI